jgi:hypothetical protein
MHLLLKFGVIENIFEELGLIEPVTVRQLNQVVGRPTGQSEHLHLLLLIPEGLLERRKVGK